MINVRSSEERGRGGASWLDTRYSFSFADYYDPGHMGFRALRVLNEDWIAPGRGFPAHPHRDMEILTYPISGALVHRDSRGGQARLEPGRIQLMTAGTGIVHSEVNPSTEEALDLLQIWLLPDQPGHAPRYQELDVDSGSDPIRTLVTPDGRDGSLAIHQDASVHRVRLGAGEEASYALDEDRFGWVQLIEGDASLNDTPLRAGDGAAAIGERSLRIRAEQDSEALLFDLA